MCEKKSLSAESGLCGGWPNSTFLPVKKALIWADVSELALSCWTMIRLFVRFSNFSKEFWCTIQKSASNVAQGEQSLHDPFCRRNRRLQSVFSTNNYLWIWLLFEGPHDGLLFCFGLIRIYSWFVICDNIPTFICTNRQEPFLSDSWIQREQTFFKTRCSCNIECMLVR